MRILKKRGALNSFLFFILVPLIVFSAVSCTSKIRSFNENESVIDVDGGSLFSISLKEDHAKGQTWTVVSTQNSGCVTYIKSNYQGTSTDLTDFIFEANALGIDTLQFNLVEYSEVTRRHVVRVVVQ